MDVIVGSRKDSLVNKKLCSLKLNTLKNELAEKRLSYLLKSHFCMFLKSCLLFFNEKMISKLEAEDSGGWTCT